MAGDTWGNHSMDKIHIRDILLRCIIGLYDHERHSKQDVVINITLHADLRDAGVSDDIEKTVDYKTIKEKIVSLVEGSSFNLVEALAENIASVCLESEGVQKVDVLVEKPGALRFTRTVGVEISRENED